jgi:hypothetical protein
MDVTLDPAEERRASMEALRLEIESVVVAGKADGPAKVVALIQASSLGAKVIRAGFGGKTDETARVSFSEFCVDHNALGVLRAVVESASDDIDYRSTCCADYKVGNDIWSGWRQSLHQHAVKVSSPEALRLAFEFDPKERCIDEHWRVLGGTLHFYALVRVFAAHDTLAAAECCRVLLEMKAPLSESDPKAEVAAGVFFDGGDWAERAEVVRPLLAEYVAAGLVDLDAPPYALKPDFMGMLPLRAAMAQGNISGAVACIDSGCDIEKAVTEAGVRRSTAAKDILELARSITLETGEQEAHLVASVTEAVMRRAMRTSDVTSGSPAPVAPRRRRSMAV